MWQTYHFLKFVHLLNHGRWRFYRLWIRNELTCYQFHQKNLLFFLSEHIWFGHNEKFFFKKKYWRILAFHCILLISTSASGLRASNGFFRPTNGFLPASFLSGCYERLIFQARATAFNSRAMALKCRWYVGSESTAALRSSSDKNLLTQVFNLSILASSGKTLIARTWHRFYTMEQASSKCTTNFWHCGPTARR